MLYELPGHRPPLTLVGPHDTTFWAALGMEPADRHALVIGAASAPATATVIVGTLLDLARYLDPFTGLPTSIGALAAQARAGLSADEARALRPEPPAPKRPVPVDPGIDLITLPHSGIRVPHDRFRVSRYRELPTADGVAFTATLKLDKTIVGLIQNEGTGGPTHFEPTDLPYRQLNAYVQACRTAVGQPCSEEHVLDELVTEYLTARRIARCERAGRCALRLMSPLGEGPDFDGEYHTAGEADAAAVTTDARRAALASQVRRQMPPDDDQWWQLWTGQRWEDLTPRPATSTTSSPSRTRPASDPRAHPVVRRTPVTKRLWFDLTATLRLAEHAASCDTFPGYGDYGREPCLLIQTGQRGRLESNGRSDQPTPASVQATHVDGGEGERWDRPTPAVYLRLTHPDDGTDETLLDTLRHHAASGACWFTVDADSGHADGSVSWAVRHARDTRDLPAKVTWVPAQVAAGELGPYPAQVAHGYHRDGAVHARFDRDTVWWIALDLQSLPAGQRPAETLRVIGERVERVGRPGTDRETTAPLPPDPDGWWRIGGEGWPWTVVDGPLQPGGVDADLFVAWGPDGDRCTVCHAVDQLDHQAMPSVAGYGQDTSTRCRRCGSYETTDPIFGAHPQPAPWPPAPDRQATLDRQANLDRQVDRRQTQDPRQVCGRRADCDGQPRPDQPDQAGS